MEDTKLAWLAGLWDGEGSIAMFERKERNRIIKFCPALVLVNTNLDIINEAQKLLKELGANFHFFTRKSNNPKWKTVYQLTTRNSGYIAKVLVAINPYLVGKRSQAELMLRYLNRRSELPRTHASEDKGFERFGNSIMTAITNQNATRSERSTTKRQTQIAMI